MTISPLPAHGASWDAWAADIDAAARAGGGSSLPTQTGNAGKYLTTNGTAASWATVSGGSGAGLPATVVNKTTAYTAAAGDFVQADATSAGFTVTLPAAPAVGALVAVKKVDASANTLTIAPSGSGTIDGDPTATTTTKMAGAIFEHVGSDVWRIVASMTTTGPAGPAGPAGPTGPTGPTGPQGPGFTARGAWAATTVYAVNDIVTNGGQTYRSLTAHTSGASFTGAGTNWELWAAKGADGTGGGGGGYPSIPMAGRMYTPMWSAGSVAADATSVGGQTYGIPIYLPAGTVTRLILEKPGGTNTAGTARLGIFALDKNTVGNSTLVVDAGAADISNAGGTPMVTLSQVITAGWYLLCCTPSVSSHSFKSVLNGYGYAGGVYANGSSPLPQFGYLGASGVSAGYGSTFGGTGTGTNVVPLILVEMSPS